MGASHPPLHDDLDMGGSRGVGLCKLHCSCGRVARVGRRRALGAGHKAVVLQGTGRQISFSTEGSHQSPNDKQPFGQKNSHLDEGIQWPPEGEAIAHAAHALAICAVNVGIVVCAVVAQGSTNLHVLQDLCVQGAC